MQVVRCEDVEPWVSAGLHRTGGLEFRDLLCGAEGAEDNFWMTLVQADGNFFSPRHRHNFDQLRFCLEGKMSVGPDLDLKAGQIGFFPEGMHYGPQQDTMPNKSMVLQFGGMSRCGFVSRRQLFAAQEELRREGTFEQGVYKRTTGEGRKNQDGFEAVYEKVFGHSFTYPKPRYADAVIMAIDNFEWVPNGTRGAAHKLLGVFTEREIRLDMSRLDAGVSLEMPGRPGQSLFFVVKGSGTSGGHAYRQYSAIEAVSDEAIGLTADEPTEVLRVTLPPLH